MRKTAEIILTAVFLFAFGYCGTLLINQAHGASCWNGSGSCVRTDGVRSGSNVFQQERDASIPIRADLMDVHGESLADGIEEALNINGENSMAADLAMGSNKITGLADGTTATGVANIGQIQNSDFIWGGTSSGTDTITFTVTPTLTAYEAGQVFWFIKSSSANATTTPTININSVGADTVVERDGTTALHVGDLPADALIGVMHDGTNWRLLSVSETSAVDTLGSVGSTTSGTTEGVTGIAANVCQVELTFDGVSHDGTSEFELTIGDSGGLETSGYVGIGKRFDTSVNSFNSTTDAWQLTASTAASDTLTGTLTLTLHDGNNFIWILSGSLSRSDGDVMLVNGSKTLTSRLTQLSLGSASGDTLDAGAITHIERQCS